VKLPAIGAALLLATGLAGCASSGKKIETVRFWAMGREGEVVQELVRDFERENPDIHVRVQQIPWSAAHEKLLTAYVGRATPDAAQLGNTWVPEFAALRALEPLDGWLDSSTPLHRDLYFSGIWDTNVIEGRTFGVPWYVDTRVLFYRKDLLARAGYDSIPQSWSGWRDAMKAIKRVSGKNHFAIFLPMNEFTQPVILGLQAGSPLLADNGTRGAFADSTFRRAFDFYLQMFREGLAPPIGNTEIANLYQEFERGYFAMYITGPWNLGEFKSRLPPAMQPNWATSPLPGPTGAASGLSLAGGSSLVLFRESRHKEAAWKWIAFLSRPEIQTRFYHVAGDLPARVESWRDSSLASDAKIRAFGVQLERVVPSPKVPEWELIANRLQDTAELVIRGGVAPDSALSRLDRDVDRILEKRRWILSRGHRLAAAVP
jgi:multiple sugar transport system substrate-binding protein